MIPWARPGQLSGLVGKWAKGNVPPPLQWLFRSSCSSHPHSAIHSSPSLVNQDHDISGSDPILFFVLALSIVVMPVVVVVSCRIVPDAESQLK